MSIIDYTPFGIVANHAVSLVGVPNAPYASVDDINAITTYMANAKAEASSNPVASKVIADYSKWISDLSWYKLHFDTGTALGEAKYYRDKLNTALGSVLDPTVTTGDAEFNILYPAATVDPTPTTPLIPIKYKYGIAIGAGAIVTIAVLMKLKVL
jgi:hypothetical protein